MGCTVVSTVHSWWSMAPLPLSTTTTIVWTLSVLASLSFAAAIPVAVAVTVAPRSACLRLRTLRRRLRNLLWFRPPPAPLTDGFGKQRCCCCYRFVTWVVVVVVAASVTTCGCLCTVVWHLSGAAATTERCNPSTREAATSSCATGIHLSRNLGRNNSVKVLRNCLLIEQ